MAQPRTTARLGEKEQGSRHGDDGKGQPNRTPVRIGLAEQPNQREKNSQGDPAGPKVARGEAGIRRRPVLPPKMEQVKGKGENRPSVTIRLVISPVIPHLPDGGNQTAEEGKQPDKTREIPPPERSYGAAHCFSALDLSCGDGLLGCSLFLVRGEVGKFSARWRTRRSQRRRGVPGSWFLVLGSWFFVVSEAMGEGFEAGSSEGLPEELAEAGLLVDFPDGLGQA